MIIWQGEQGSDEWLLARSTIPTASNFKKILTAGGKKSTQSKAYMNELLANWLAGKPIKDGWQGNASMAAGNERESECRDLYSFISGHDVEEVGLVYLNEDKRVSCSPDGLVGKDGCVEFKNPDAGTLIEYILADRLPPAYKPQVQGQMWVCERMWCDFFVAHPDINQQLLIRVERDDKYIATMKTMVFEFVEQMLEAREQLTQGDK